MAALEMTRRIRRVVAKIESFSIFVTLLEWRLLGLKTTRETGDFRLKKTEDLLFTQC